MNSVMPTMHGQNGIFLTTAKLFSGPETPSVENPPRSSPRVESRDDALPLSTGALGEFPGGLAIVFSVLTTRRPTRRWCRRCACAGLRPARRPAAQRQVVGPPEVVPRRAGRLRFTSTVVTRSKARAANLDPPVRRRPLTGRPRCACTRSPALGSDGQRARRTGTRGA
jgi:hypothetical protein